jgi:YfiH family protein
MISRDPSVWLSVTVADCLPVFLYDPESGGFGLVHSGWKGTGISLRALRLMESQWHTKPEKVSAILGPCIQSCCYQVDEARARTFEAAFGGPGGAYPLGPVVRQVETPSGTSWYLDLQAANARLLANEGVRTIAVCQDCTFTEERLGSFRREGAASYTRMSALIGYREWG